MSRKMTFVLGVAIGVVMLCAIGIGILWAVSAFTTSSIIMEHWPNVSYIFN